MILIVSAVFPPEPVVSANLSYDIAKCLSLRNEVVVISPKPTRPYKTKYDQILNLSYPFTHHILDTFTCSKSSIFGRLLESYSMGKSTSKFLLSEKNKIDVIYANTWPIFAQLFLIKTAKKLNIPVIIHIQDIYPESLIKKLPYWIGNILNKLILPVDNYILRNSKKIITISSQMKNYLSVTRNINESKINVIRNWQNDKDFIHEKINVIKKENTFTFMYLGSISPSAGVEFLIYSFIKSNITNSKLVIAGNGSDKDKCIELAQKFKAHNILFWDAPKHQVGSIQSKADVFLLPLRKGIGKTASPSKLPAYMFSSKPIIACVDEDSDTASTILSSDAGWVLPPENIEYLAGKMKTIASFPSEVLMQKGKNGYNFAMQNFSKENNLRKLVAIINEINQA